jgi:DNA-binding Lrp family transcriptional regulator
MALITPDSLTLDRIDNLLLHALMIDGRAPFSLLADVIGSSEQTVARRYRRLHEAGAVRVLVLPAASDQDLDWIVRIGTRPGGAARLAAALAARNDVSWVRITSGGAEIVCISRPSSLEERDALLLERLARTNLVTTVAAHAIMKLFAGAGINDWSGFDDPLDRAQLAALRPSAPVRRSGEAGEPRPEDARLLEVLREDGRAGYAELAAAAGISSARARRRLEKLVASGRAYVQTDVATELLGFQTSASLWLSVAPADVERVGARLGALEQTTFVAAVTGPTNLTASVVCRSPTELYGLLTDEIGAIGSVHSAEVSPVIRRVKQGGTVFHGTRLRL